VALICPPSWVLRRTQSRSPAGPILQDKTKAPLSRSEPAEGSSKLYRSEPAEGSSKLYRSEPAEGSSIPFAPYFLPLMLSSHLPIRGALQYPLSQHSETQQRGAHCAVRHSGEAALRSLAAPTPTRGGVRRQAGGWRRGATRTGETEVGDAQPWRGEGPTRGCRAGGDKSSEPRLNLSGSWQQGHSAAYNTPFLIQVVCK
jgi:hypothetical protein